MATIYKCKYWYWMCFLHLLFNYEAATAEPIPASCYISQITNVIFSDYNPFATTNNDTGVGKITVTCSKGNYSYTIDLSCSGAPNCSSRQMTTGTSTLSYNLYSNSARTLIWGNAAAGTTPVRMQGNCTSTTCKYKLPIYGRIMAQQAGANANSYKESVTATFTVSL